MPPQQMHPQQMHPQQMHQQQMHQQQMRPQQMQAQLQNPAQVMYQDRHHFPGQISSEREHFTNAVTNGRDEKPKHKHRSRKPSRQGSSYQGSENGAQSEVGGYAPSHGTAHSSETLRRFIGDSRNCPRDIPSPPSSIYSASDGWSDSGRSESSATTVRACAAPGHRYPETSADLSRAYQRSMSLSSATTSSIAPSSQYGGDDERSESEYTSCAPGPIAHNSSSAESQVERYENWMIGHFDVMETFLSKMQSDVQEMKHDFITNGGTSPLNETYCQGIRFQLGKIWDPFLVIEQFFNEFSQGNSLGQM